MTDDETPPKLEGVELPADQPRRRLHFHSDELSEPFRELVSSEITIDVESVVQLADSTHLQYWRVSHAPVDKLVEAVGEFPTTLDVEFLSTDGDTHRLEVRGSEASLFGAFARFGGVTKSATYDEDGVNVVAEFEAGIDSDAVEATVQEIYPDLVLSDSYTVESVSAFRHLVRNRLTQRQVTVLQVAYFSGYYEQPRRRTGTELAERLDITRQAFHDHLRKAHATVFEALIEDGRAFTEVDR